VKKTNSNKQAESNFPLLTKIVCILKKIFTARQIQCWLLNFRWALTT